MRALIQCLVKKFKSSEAATKLWGFPGCEPENNRTGKTCFGFQRLYSTSLHVKLLTMMQAKHQKPKIAHLSLPWSIGWVALSFLVCRPAMVTPNQISTFFNIYRHKSVVLTQFHLISSSTKLHWPSTTKYQPVPPHTDPVPPNTNQHRLLLSQYYHVSTSSASY